MGLAIPSSENFNVTIAAVASVVSLVIIFVGKRAESLIPPCYTLKSHIKDIKTGDLLFFTRSYNLQGDLMKFALGSPYIHVGVAFVSRQKEYVLEIAARCGKVRGVQLNLLKDRVSRKGEVCAVRHLSVPVCNKLFSKAAIEFVNTLYSYNFTEILLTKWIGGLYLLPSASACGIGAAGNSTKSKICTELVVSLLTRLNVMQDCCTCYEGGLCVHALTPSDFLVDYNLQLNDTYSFGELRKVVL